MAVVQTGMATDSYGGVLQYQNRAYSYNGRNRMRKFDGVAWNKAGISRLASSGASLAISTTGSLLGTYFYYLVPVNSKHFNAKGEVVAGIPCARLGPKYSNSAITISSIPATYAADTQVDKWYIYRNRAGQLDSNLQDETQDFYKVGEIAIGTTSFKDTVADSALASLEQVRFNQNIPPTFKHALIYGDRMFGFGFDPIKTGTATVNTDTTKVDFSGVSLPDGVVGCWFRKSGDTQQYRITAYNSATQITLDRAFVGAMSGSAYFIYRYNYEIYGSAQYDMEAWGPDGEGRRWKRETPGRDEIRGAIVYGGQVLVFSPMNIYALYGKGSSWDDIKMTPEPTFQGLGCVSHRSLVVVDNELYGMSLRGPFVMRGGGPELIGRKLGLDWLETLTSEEQKQICSGSDGENVWFSYPVSGQSQCSKTWRYDRRTGNWWAETGLFPQQYVNDEGDGGIQGKCYAVQGRRIIRLDYGTTDVATSSYTGTVTTGGTTSLTNSGASFPTSNGGLEECMVHVFRAGAYVGSRRIISNTATSVTWSSTAVGGGSLTVSVGDTYVIGAVYWRARTKAVEQPDSVLRAMNLVAHMGRKGSSYVLRKIDVHDGTAATDISTVTADRTVEPMAINSRDGDYAVWLESYTGAVVREVSLDAIGKDSEK